MAQQDDGLLREFAVLGDRSCLRAHEQVIHAGERDQFDRHLLLARIRQGGECLAMVGAHLCVECRLDDQDGLPDRTAGGS